MSYVTPEAVDAAADVLTRHIESGEMRPHILARLVLNAAAPWIAAEASNLCRHCGRKTPTHRAVDGAAACNPKITDAALTSRPEMVTCKRCKR